MNARKAEEDFMRKKIKTVVLSVFIAAMSLSILGGCYVQKGIKATELTAAYLFNKNAVEETDDKTLESIGGFGVDLLKKVIDEKSGGNVLISPFSAAACLGMIANGVKNETLAEFEKVLGASVNDVNKTLNKFIANSGEEVKTGNSLWVKNGSSDIENGYLKTIKESYNAEIYGADFDGQTLKDINNWCANKTDGMIPEIIEQIEPQEIVYFINALLFDAKWKEKYEKKDIKNAAFTAYNGSRKTVDMMYSSEYTYLGFTNGDGFLKPYEGGKYSFLGILPREGVSVYDFVAGFGGEEYFKAYKARQSSSLTAGIPEFSFDYTVNLKNPLIEAGLEKVFTPEADFGNFGKSKNGNAIYLDFVLQKTKIEVDRNGTKAAAITIGGGKDSAAPAPAQIILDRPFVFGIVENSSGLPLFLGVVTNL